MVLRLSCIEDNLGCEAIRDALEEIDSDMGERLTHGFGPSHSAGIAKELELAGFSDVAAEAVQLTATLESAEDLPSQWLRCSIAICMKERRGDPRQRDRDAFISRASHSIRRFTTAAGSVEVLGAPATPLLQT